MTDYRIQHVNLFKAGASGSDTDILDAKGLGPSSSKTELRPNRSGTTFRLTISLGGNAVLKMVMDNGTDTVETELNNGAAIVANKLTTLAFSVDSLLTYEFQTVGVSVDINQFLVEEVSFGVV